MEGEEPQASRLGRAAAGPWGQGGEACSCKLEHGRPTGKGDEGEQLRQLYNNALMDWLCRETEWDDWEAGQMEIS